MDRRGAASVLLEYSAVHSTIEKNSWDASFVSPCRGNSVGRTAPCSSTQSVRFDWKRLRNTGRTWLQFCIDWFEKKASVTFLMPQTAAKNSLIFSRRAES